MGNELCILFPFIIIVFSHLSARCQDIWPLTALFLFFASWALLTYLLINSRLPRLVSLVLPIHQKMPQLILRVRPDKLPRFLSLTFMPSCYSFIALRPRFLAFLLSLSSFLPKNDDCYLSIEPAVVELFFVAFRSVDDSTHSQILTFSLDFHLPKISRFLHKRELHKLSCSGWTRRAGNAIDKIKMLQNAKLSEILSQLVCAAQSLQCQCCPRDFGFISILFCFFGVARTNGMTAPSWPPFRMQEMMYFCGRTRETLVD